jgi:hypothetical protein
MLLYLYDSSVLLYSNEAVLTCDGKGRWSARTGFAGFLLAGRTLCVLGPFTPHRPAFRLSWDFNSLEPKSGQTQWSERARALNALMPTTLAAGLALFMVLPLGMFTALGAYAVIPALILLYGSIIISLVLVRRRRMLIAPDGRRFLALAFECLACPPFGVNMVRRSTLGLSITEPLPLAAARLLDVAGWAELRSFCISRLEDSLRLSQADSAEGRELEAQKQRLLGLECKS